MPQGGFGGPGPQMNAPGQGQFQEGFQPMQAPPMEAQSDAPKTELKMDSVGFKMDALKVAEFVPAG